MNGRRDDETFAFHKLRRDEKTSRPRSDEKLTHENENGLCEE